MRKRFNSKTLKQHFVTAWLCMPEEIQTDLYKFIRQIRDVENLEGTYIGCPDGTRYGPLEDGEGFTFLYKDESIAFCDIILSVSLVQVSQAHTISTILHELAHVLECFVASEDAVAANRFESEVNAWDRAISWAKDGISDSKLAQEVVYAALRAKLRLGLHELTEITKTIIDSEDS